MTAPRGSVRKQWGKLAADDVDQVQGDSEILLGRIQERYGRPRDRAERKVSDWLDRP